MAEKLYAHALTTVERVKEKLSINKSDPDAVLLRLVNSITDFIESECNRRFKQQVYTDEKYSVYGETQTRIFLKQAPVVELTSVKYRQGVVGSPVWTPYTVNDYELEGDGSTGIIKFYTYLSRGLIPGTNIIQASYKAGFLIDWANFGDLSKHNLPADITELAERLAIKAYKKREVPGKSTEKFDQGFITWSTDMDNDDKRILSAYRRLPVFL